LADGKTWSAHSAFEQLRKPCGFLGEASPC
jgi:hypothetical protein